MTTSLDERPAGATTFPDPLALLAEKLGAVPVADPYPARSLVVALPRCLTATLAAELSVPGPLPIVLDGTAYFATWARLAPKILGRRLAGRDVYLVGLPIDFETQLATAISAAEPTTEKSAA